MAERFSSVPDAGWLALVGIGPGLAEHLTARARQVLEEATLIVGYDLYLDQVRSWLESGQLTDSRGAAPRRYVSSRLTEERERAERAVTEACAGERVALISSGDAGVYGMAGLAFEVLETRGWDGRRPAVEVVPGVTAAQAAAAVLGAPLMSDYATISLSDLLTPWEVIERRIAAAGTGDFVVAFYNPTSQRRRGHLRRAAAILRESRTEDTPVALVRNALRSGQSHRLTTLGCLAEARTACELDAMECAKSSNGTPLCLVHQIDMLTLVIVGNSVTVAVGGRLVTRRGYRLE